MVALTFSSFLSSIVELKPLLSDLETSIDAEGQILTFQYLDL